MPNTKKPVFDTYIKSFGRYAALKSYARDVEDLELLSVCGVVEEFEGRIPSLIKRITGKAVDVGEADITLTTAHKAKGLEWDNVLMMDDFQILSIDDQFIDPADIDPDEFNLIYVSMTRAMSNLRFDKKSNIPEFIKLYQRRLAS